MPQYSVTNKLTARNRRKNDCDSVPLLQDMQDQNSDNIQHENYNNNAKWEGLKNEKGVNTKNSSNARKDKASFSNCKPQTTEDIMAFEPSFEGYGTSVAFYYDGQEKTEKQSDDDLDYNEKKKKLLSYTEDIENDDTKHIFLQPLTYIRKIRKALKNDISSICLLLLLYLLQGVPLGLIAAIPLILQSKEVKYGQQAIFSFAYWPFSLKLLWAPIVDSIYCKKIGRRKSWMVPCQYLIGAFLLTISYFVPEILGSEGKNGTEGKTPNVVILMSVFLPLNFLAATQDIAVDGWALTMLSRKNVGYASTCNVVGQTIGFFLGNVVFLTLQSKDFANKYIRSVPSDKGLVEFDGFVFFWGWVFLVTTTAVLFFKREVDYSVVEKPNEKTDVYNQISIKKDDEELELNVFETYGILVKIMCLKPMLLMVVVLLTAKIAFAATDGMTDLKLIAAGITTDKIACRSIFLTPLQIILPWLLGKHTAGSKPLNVFLWAYPYRLVMGVVFAFLVYWTPLFKEENGEYPYSYYIIWILAYYLHQISSYCIFLSMMAFNAQISDPKIGGTYMTLLNTLNNLGGNWPVTLFLSITDFFNRKNCIAKGTKIILGTCNNKRDEELCKVGGDLCEFSIDGYYISVGICTVIGLLWFKIFYHRVQYFQKISRQEWRVIKNTN